MQCEGMAISEDIKQTNLNKSIHKLQEIDLIICSITDTISKIIAHMPTNPNRSSGCHTKPLTRGVLI
jgi:hypothetical protein